MLDTEQTVGNADVVARTLKCRLANAAGAVVGLAAIGYDCCGGARAFDDAGAFFACAAGLAACDGVAVSIEGAAAAEIAGVNAFVLGAADPVGRALLVEVALAGRSCADAALAVTDFAGRAVCAVERGFAVDAGIAAIIDAGLANHAAGVITTAGCGAFAYDCVAPGIGAGEVAIGVAGAFSVAAAGGGCFANTAAADAVVGALIVADTANGIDGISIFVDVASICDVGRAAASNDCG